MDKNRNIISLFSGAGGLDKGFEKAGFKTIWANEYDKSIWNTFRHNFPNTYLDTRSIRDIPSEEIPDCIGIIGGPPCQSWSEAGSLRGIKDDRGKLFYEFIRILKDKQPLFFLAENVSGMLAKRHQEALDNIILLFKESGYNVEYKLLNALNYNVPQDRKRVIFVGFHKEISQIFDFPKPSKSILTLETIQDLQSSAIPAQEKNYSNHDLCSISNNEYFTGGFSSIYMSRNRVRNWNEPSFTIQAGARHAPIHPQAPKMVSIGKDERIFQKGKEYLYRRLSIRECARIQTFPDDFLFLYKNVADGYKMVGNAVPVNLAFSLAKQIMKQLSTNKKQKENKYTHAEYQESFIF